VEEHLQVLVSAYACEPGKGSEPYVGWNMPIHLARHHDVWLLTRANNRGIIEAELRKRPIPNLNMVYFDLPGWARFWKKGHRGIHLYYYLWQIGAYFVAKRLHRETHFDIVHHLTFGIDWLPSFLALLPVPFIWGPIVGAQPVSKVFRQTFSLGAKCQESVRIWIRRLSRLDPMMRCMARKTAIAVASGVQVGKQLRSLGCRTVLTYPSVGISMKEIEDLLSLKTHDSNGKVRFACVGNLYAFRAFSLTLKAFASIRQDFRNAELWIVGDGPERARLMHQSQELGTTDAVKFWGKIPRHELLALLATCDVLVYPCLRGAISMACVEAMAAGLPVICLDLGGTALQVDDQSGVKIRAVSPQQVTVDLTEAMGLLAEDGDLRRRLGDAARRRVKDEFTWNAKALHVSEMYRQARIAAGRA
jgi:glycosyltransferase involved in cell wall biosynthesis